MSRPGYPTRNGLIISPYDLGYTRPTNEDLQIRRRVTIHHGNFTKAAYSSTWVGHVFRNLVSNVYPMLNSEHSALHERHSPPKPPERTLMIDIVEEFLAEEGIIRIVKEKNTHDFTDLSRERWNQLLLIDQRLARY